MKNNLSGLFYVKINTNLEENRFKNVLTCLNSGNVVFESDEKRKEKTTQQNLKGQTILFGSFYYVFYLVICFMFDKRS
ncbi:MAG TPA: hypothetical protein DEV78_01385 [Clostridiales bacterium]|nr:hypothetical protein [Clostridiales bacterium]